MFDPSAGLWILSLYPLPKSKTSCIKKYKKLHLIGRLRFWICGECWVSGAFNKFPVFWYRHLKFTVIAIQLMRWQTNFYDFRFKWTATAAIGTHPTKVWLSQLVNFKNAIRTLEERYPIKFCFKLGKNAMWWKLDLLLWPRDQETVPGGRMLALPDLRRPDRANPHTNFWWSLFFFFFFDSTGMIYMHWVPTGLTVN